MYGYMYKCMYSFSPYSKQYDEAHARSVPVSVNAMAAMEDGRAGKFLIRFLWFRSHPETIPSEPPVQNVP